MPQQTNRTRIIQKISSQNAGLCAVLRQFARTTGCHIIVYNICQNGNLAQTVAYPGSQS
jgi:hypothetical protein